MSENFGKCLRCKGAGFFVRGETTVDCLACDGTGRSGDAMDYVQRQANMDWEREGLSRVAGAGKKAPKDGL
jgi:hypothetical protein